jgi:SAM-dependent methyltransferase
VLGNLINRHDAARLFRKLRQGHLRQITDKVRTPGPKRVMDCWSAPGHEPGPVQWDDIPAVRRRWHTFGGPETRFAEHATRRWLSGRSGLRALSLGCGLGDRELEWARLGVFAQITGVDISPEQIECATRKAKEAGLDHLLTFQVADARQALRLCLAAEDQALGRLGHDFTYAVCSVLAAPVPAACATGQRGPLGPGYDTTLDEAS